MKQKLDERQLMNRYKIGLQSFLLLMLLLLLDILIQDVFGLTWASHFCRTMILFYIMLAFFTIRCIFTDSYFAERDLKSVRGLMFIFILCGAVTAISIIAAAARGKFVLIESNQLNDKSLAIFYTVETLLIPLCYFLKRRHDRKEETK